MVIGVVKCPEENLVALVPQVTTKLIKDEYQVVVESGAGKSSGYSDELYESAGAVISSRKEVLSKADVILTGTSIPKSDLDQIKTDAILVGKFNGRVESE